MRSAGAGRRSCDGRAVHAKRVSDYPNPNVSMDMSNYQSSSLHECRVVCVPVCGEFVVRETAGAGDREHEHEEQDDRRASLLHERVHERRAHISRSEQEDQDTSHQHQREGRRTSYQVVVVEWSE